MGIITATKSDVRKISPNLSSIEMINRQENVDVTGLDVDMKKKIVYWSDGESLKALKKSFFSFEIKMYVEG